MKSTKRSSGSRAGRPALSPEARENQMIAYAMDLAERQLKEGTASSGVLVHYLKLATVKESLEREKLIEENKLLRAKTEALEAAKDTAEMYAAAVAAMQEYGSHSDSGDMV